MDASGRRWPRADLRVGDADRQAVVAELQRHYVDGRLTSEELSERVDQALRARTFGDLAVPLAELPPLGEYSATTTLEHRPEAQGEWTHPWPPPLGAALIAVAVVAIFLLLALETRGVVLFPFFPMLIWGFFFFGRPYRGRRRF